MAFGCQDGSQIVHTLSKIANNYQSYAGVGIGMGRVGGRKNEMKAYKR